MRREVFNRQGGLVLAVGETVEEARAAALDAVAARKAASYATGAVYGGKRYRVHPERLQIVTGLYASVRAGDGLPGGAAAVPFEATDGTVVQIAEADIPAFALAIRDHAGAVEAAALTHAKAIEALTTAAAVAEYDMTAGWP